MCKLVTHTLHDIYMYCGGLRHTYRILSNNIVDSYNASHTKDDPITFSEWAAHPDGGSIDDSWVNSIMLNSLEKRQEAMRPLYRKFADQLINTLGMRGAP